MVVLSITSITARLLGLDPFAVDQGVPFFESMIVYLPTIVLLGAALREGRHSPT